MNDEKILDKVAAPEEKAVQATPGPEAFENPWDDRVDQTLPDVPPFIKVLYDNTKNKPEGAANGLLFNNVTGEVSKTIKVLLLHARVGMIMFPEEFATDNNYLCRSNDGLVPVGDGDDPQPGPCRKEFGNGRLVEACPMAKWGDGPRGERTPPACSTKYQLLLWDLETNLPVMTTCQKAEAANFRQLKTQLKAKAMRAMVRHGNPSGIPAFMLMPIELSTMKKVGPRGTFFPKTFRVLDDEVNLELAKDVLTQLGNLRSIAERTDIDADNEIEKKDTPRDSVEPEDGEIKEGPFPLY